MALPEFTKTERLILANQYRILHHLEPDQGHDLAIEALNSGFSEEYSRLIEEPEDYSPQDQKDVIDLFQMLRVFKNAVAKLPREQQDEIDGSEVTFDGFDGNLSRYHYAAFCIDKLELWKEHADVELNSHSAAPERKYARMLAAFRAADEPYQLTFEDLKRIATAAARA